MFLRSMRVAGRLCWNVIHAYRKDGRPATHRLQSRPAVDIARTRLSGECERVLARCKPRIRTDATGPPGNVGPFDGLMRVSRMARRAIDHG